MKTMSHTQRDKCLIFGVLFSLTCADLLTLRPSTFRGRKERNAEVGFKKKLLSLRVLVFALHADFMFEDQVSGPG